MLIIHGGHHKVMTVYFDRTFHEIADTLGLKYQKCTQDALDPDTKIFFEEHSQINFTQLTAYTGTHIVRDPRDIVVSAYFYHLWCQEPWCCQKHHRWQDQPWAIKYGWNDGVSYQEQLNRLSKDDGIAFEIERSSCFLLRNISQWDYDNPSILEIKYEDLVSPRYESTIQSIFEHYGFSGHRLQTCVDVMKGHSLMNQSDRKPGEEKTRSHLRKGTPGDWKNHFSDRHKQMIKKTWGDLLIRLGYEQDTCW